MFVGWFFSETNDRDSIICPFDLMGRCEDKKCKYQHLSTWWTKQKVFKFLFNFSLFILTIIKLSPSIFPFRSAVLFFILNRLMPVQRRIFGRPIILMIEENLLFFVFFFNFFFFLLKNILKRKSRTYFVTNITNIDILW